MAYETGQQLYHRVELEGRDKLTVSGVEDVERFDDQCIVLRTGILKNGMLHVQAGAGIVADSNPEYEQRECEAKAGALIAAAREAVRVASEAGFGQ